MIYQTIDAEQGKLKAFMKKKLVHKMGHSENYRQLIYYTIDRHS